VLYHLGDRTIEHSIQLACRKHEVALVGYSPFGSGNFPRPKSPGGRVLAEVSARHGATPHQVALAFLTRDAGTFAIPKAAQLGHVEDNGGSLRFALTPEDLLAIDEAFPRGPRRRGAPML
jgi:diketogulonate reductase-like aldo/keto reductase